jgi:uncharacterized membrane protein YeiH
MLTLSLDNIITWIDIVGVIAFAISGALEASRRQMDLVGFILIATVTGLGGGTIRDLILGIAPVSWVSNPTALILCSCIAVFIFFTAHIVESRFKALVWCDAVGLAICCVIGAEKALTHGASAVVAILMGVMTATFGGLVRDTLCNEVPLILRKEIYATAAAAGSTIYVILAHFEASRALMVTGAFLTAFLIRAFALRYHLSLPSYKSRAGREIE